MARLRKPPAPETVSTSPRPGLEPFLLAPSRAPFVSRRLSQQSARGLEVLGHAIEYLADEYACDEAAKGPLGNADPRIAAIQTLKSLNRAIYFSGAEVPPVWQRIRQWLSGPATVNNIGSRNRQ